MTPHFTNHLIQHQRELKKAPVKSVFDENYYPSFSTKRYWCTKKYTLTRNYQNDGSTKYSFSITDSKPYLRTRAKVIRPNLTRKKLWNKFVFEVLKKKNLYYLKKPFEELTLYIAPMSMRFLMNCVHIGERLYILSAIAFYWKSIMYLIGDIKMIQKKSTEI